MLLDDADQFAADPEADLIDQAASAAHLSFSDELRAELRRRLSALKLAGASPEDMIDEARRVLAEFTDPLTLLLADGRLAAWLAGAGRVAARLPALTPRPASGAPPGLPPTWPPAPPSPFDEGKEYRWDWDGLPAWLPMIDEAVRDLQARRLVTRYEYDAMSQEARRDSFTVAHLASEEAIRLVRDAVVRAVDEGTGLPQFLQEVDEALEGSTLGTGHLENVFRTGISQATTEGMDRILEKPIVREQFPYEETLPVKDSRLTELCDVISRSGLDGTGIFRADDPVWQKFKPPRHWQCRCSRNALSVAEAARRGIREAMDWHDTGEAPETPAWVPHPPVELPRGWNSEGGLRMSAGWVRYQGPQGGHGWQNPATGEVRYQDEMPGAAEGGQEPAEASSLWQQARDAHAGPQPANLDTPEGREHLRKRHEHGKAIIQALLEGKPVPPEALKGYEREAQNIARYGKAYPKSWEISEEDFIGKKHEDAAKNYQRGLDANAVALAQLGPGATKKREHLELQVHFWSEWLKNHAAGPTQAQKERYRDEYVETVRKAISKGEPVPESIIQQRPEFQKAQNARARYDKGRHTSFANESVAVNAQMKGETGYKVKRQDGKPMKPEQIAEIASAVKEVESALGPIHDVMDAANLTIAHTSGTHPFLSTAGGLYSPGQRTVTTGIQDHMGGSIPSLAHELAHFLDIEAGAKEKRAARVYRKGAGKSYVTSSIAEDERRGGPGASLITDATSRINNYREVKRLVAAKQSEQDTPEKKAEVERVQVQLGPYWSEPREVFARLVEQYVSTKLGENGGLSASKDYTKMPGWWSGEDFQRLMPLVEKEINRRLEILREGDQPAAGDPAGRQAGTGAGSGNADRAAGNRTARATQTPPPRSPPCPRQGGQEETESRPAVGQQGTGTVRLRRHRPHDPEPCHLGERGADPPRRTPPHRRG